MADGPFTPLRAGRAPVIDGVLDDPVWQQAVPLSGFLTCVPDYGKPMLGDSKVYMAYDDENLYFAFRCYDPEPPKIKAAVSSRDNIFSDDWICINLDSFFDHQTAYGFYINPLGIQSDTRITTTSEDKAFDLVWYSAGRIDEEGYTIEVRIPTRSIRFSERDTVTMGVIFERAISRRNEQGTVPALNPAMGDAYSSWLMQMHPMVYPGLKHGTLLEMLPAVTYHDAYERAGADMRRTEHKTELGVTGKYGVTQDLILDGTYRPDFSQVESDAGQVDINLRHALIYPEKRPFFQEGSESFGLAATAASELDPVLAIVNTRTVLSPLAGAKVSGKIGEAGTVGAIYAADEMPDSESVAGGSYNHFAALRYRQSIGEDSYLGGLYTAFEQTGHHNRVAVADGQARLTPSGLLEYDAMMSWTRPDPASHELSGHTIGLKYASVTRDLDYILTFRDIAEDFNAEMGGGYIARTGISQGTALLRPKLYPASVVIRRVDLEAFTGQTRDEFYGMWETFNHVSAQAYLWGAVVVKAKYSYATEIFMGRRFETGGFHLLVQGQWTKDLFASILYRRVGSIRYVADPYQGSSDIIRAETIYQPTDKLNGDLSFVFSDLRRRSDGARIYDYPITRLKLTYQLNRYLFLRGIGEYNKYYQRLLTDFLASFTYIPGTVIHAGYGSLYDYVISGTPGIDGRTDARNRLLETARGFFFKTSYLWRL